MSQEELRRSITQKNTLIAEMNIENYLRNDIGIYGFQEIESTLLQIKTLAMKFGNCNLEDIPRKRLDRINNILNNIHNILRHFIDYDRDKPQHGTKESLIENLAMYHNDFFNDVVELITYSELDNGKTQDLEKSALNILESLKFMQNEVLQKKSETYKEAENLLKGLREISAESGVTKHSEIFAKEAISHNTSAKNWLAGIFLFIIISIIIAYCSFKLLMPSEPNPSVYQIIQYTLVKILIFAILYYLLMLFIKNYNAHRHNCIVNKHKQNALSTFQTFVNSTKDQEIKNAVLIQTTQSIFANQVSGYIKNEIEEANPNKIIEIIRSANSFVNGKS